MVLPLLGWSGAPRWVKSMSTSSVSNKDIVREYLDAFNDQDRDALAEVVADDVVEHLPHEEVHGIDEFLENPWANLKAFPDYVGTTNVMMAEGDKVAVRYTVEGTHEGEYYTIQPTGQRVEWTGMAMYRVEDDEIAEIWLEEDRLGLLDQLGVVEPPAHLRV